MTATSNQNNACNLSSIAAKLAAIRGKLDSGEYDFDQAQEEISKLEKEYKSENKSLNFQDLLEKANLLDLGFSYNLDSNNLVPQDQTGGVLSVNTKNLFRYRDTAKNKIDSYFSHKVFNFLFVNRSRDNIGFAYITYKSEFNRAVSNLKNELCKLIVKDLKITSLENINFFDSSGPIYWENNNEFNFEILMKNKEVRYFIEYSNIDYILDHPIDNPSKLDTLAAIYAINNFDILLSNELKGLITLDPAKKGFISNTKYVNEIEGKSTEYWADDSHSAKNIKNYTSNLAKFIMRLIPRGLKVNGKFKPYLGQYLSDKELYILGHILKQAEYEYNLKYLNEEGFVPVSLAVNTVETARLLLKLTSLPAFRNAKSDLLASIKNFLYEGDELNKPIIELFKDNFLKNPRILDIESLLIHEMNLSYAPTYIEYDENLIPEHKNYGGAYEHGSSLKWNITEFMFQLLKSQKPITKNYYDKSTHRFKKGKNDNNELQQVIISSVLGFDSQMKEANYQFIKDYKNDIETLTKLIVEKLYDSTTLKNNRNYDDLKLYLYLQESASAIIKNNSLNKEFKYKYYTILSDRPITQFDSNAKTTLPTYRLNSAITSDTWFLAQYRQTLYGPFLNFLVDNPLLFSKYATYQLGENNSGINKKYKDSTAYLVDIGDADKNVDFNELSASDQLTTLLMTNLLGIKDDLFHFQPVCYSDKSSVGVKVLNLIAQFTDLNGEKITFKLILKDYESSPNKVISKLRSIDYFYRKNSTVALINSILNKWDRLYELKFKAQSPFQPILRLLFNRTDMPSQLYKEILDKIEALNSFMASPNFGKIEEWRRLASLNNIELIDELDYVKVKGGNRRYIFNATVLYDFKNLENFKKFEKSQDESFSKLIESEEYKETLETLKSLIENSEKDSLIYKTLVNSDPKTHPRLNLYFDVSWNKDKKLLEAIPIKDLKGNYKLNFIFKVFTALSNLGRYSYLDLISKFEYLDPSKVNPDSVGEYIERAKRIDAMTKRMVLYPATVQQYIQGKYNGVSQEAKVAIIEDPNELTWNISGQSHNQDIYDGSGFTSPFWSFMEDASIPGHGIRGTKKTLGTSTRGTNCTLFKWASFPINNEKMRISTRNKYSLLNLFLKMHLLKWEEDIDITKGFAKDLTTPALLVERPLFIIDGLKYFKIIKLKKVGKNQYSMSLKEVDSKGEPILNSEPVPPKLVTIDSIYALWEAFGGLQSGYISDNNEIEYGEGSIEVTYLYIINCGKHDGSDLYNQKHIILPLRDKFIAIAANKSAVKRGGANFNSANEAWMTQNLPLNTFTINTSCFGVQLDANHHSDLADVREMSQTISALAGLGRTSELAEQAYRSIAELVKISLKSANKYLTAKEKNGIKGALIEISKQLVKKLSESDKIESVDAFIEMFSEDANNLILPISDRRFYKTFIKEILEDLNKSSIRRRYSGLGGILNPASNIMQVFDLGGKPYLYPDLIKAGRKYIKNLLDQTTLYDYGDLKITLKLYFDNIWENKTPALKDSDIFKLYVNILTAGPDLGILNFLNNRPIIKGLSTTKDLQTIKILDTVSYSIDGGPYVTMSLTTQENFDKFWKIIEDNWDWSVDASLLKIKVVLEMSTPHDLRPQYISWIAKRGDKEKLENIYSTRASRLSKAVGNIDKRTDLIDQIIAELSEIGQAQTLSCKL